MTRYDREELRRVVSGFLFLLVMVSLMGWCAVEPAPVKPLALEYDRSLVVDGIKRNQAAALAEATAIYNRNLELRAGGR